jgi:hypothetical protein
MRRIFSTSIKKRGRRRKEEEEDARTRERWGGAAKTGQIETVSILKTHHSV